MQSPESETVAHMFIESASVSPLRLSAVKRPLLLVDFICRAPKAHSVFLVGDFNEWSSSANPMNRMPNGGWQLRLHGVQFRVNRLCFI